jgi:hypothetical protein
MGKDYRYWEVWYISCESNKRYSIYKTDSDCSASDVRDNLTIGGIGDDIAEIISIEETGFDDLADELIIN